MVRVPQWFVRRLIEDFIYALVKSGFLPADSPQSAFGAYRIVARLNHKIRLKQKGKNRFSASHAEISEQAALKDICQVFCLVRFQA